MRPKAHFEYDLGIERHFHGSRSEANFRDAARLLSLLLRAPVCPSQRHWRLLLQCVSSVDSTREITGCVPFENRGISSLMHVRLIAPLRWFEWAASHTMREGVGMNENSDSNRYLVAVEFLIALGGVVIFMCSILASSQI